MAILAVAITTACPGSSPGGPSVNSVCVIDSLKVLDGAAQPLPASTQLAVRGTFAVSAGLWYKGSCPASGLVMTWSSAAPAVTVSQGAGNTAVVTGVAPTASVAVSVSIPGVIRSANFSVVAGPLHHIAITPASPSVAVGSTTHLSVALLDQDGFPTAGSPAPASSVIWALPTHAPVTIDAAGTVTGTSIGTVLVTATYTAVVPNLTATAVVEITAVQITSVTVAPATASIVLGATPTPIFTATIKNQNGVIVPPPAATVSWQSLDPSIATIGAVTGTVTGVSVGRVIIRAIYDGNVSIFGDAQLDVTAPPPAASLIAFALAEQPAAASYTPDPAYQYNGQGGTITATRSGTGQYMITIPGFGGAAGASRIPFVNAVGVVGVVCLPISWNMIGVTDATVRVDCSNSAGALTDAKFTIFAVGEAGLPGRFGFANSGPLPAGFSPVNLGSASAWSSSLASPQLTRDNIDVVGRFQLALKSASSVTMDVPIVQPTGATGARCQANGWSSAIEVVCFPVGSAVFADARFSGMLLDQGRAGKRFGAVHSAFAVVDRNSAGGTNTVSQTGTGTYRVVFANLGRPAGGKETVLVSAQALASAVSCNPSVWSTVGNDLVVDVACFNGAGALSSIPAFSAVVIE